MVPGFSRSQRVITVVAIGGLSIAAATLYYILRRKSSQTSLEKTPEEYMSRTSASNKIENATPTTGEIVIQKPSEPVLQMPAATPEDLPESTSDEVEEAHNIEEKVERLNLTALKAEAEPLKREPTPIDKLLDEAPTNLDWAECSLEDLAKDPNVETECETSAQTSPVRENEPAKTASFSSAASPAVVNTEESVVDTPTNTNVDSSQTKMNDTSVVTSELSANGRDYKMADSPSVDSTHSEISNDSGRATVNAPPTFSPFDSDGSILPMYEFEVPNTLVGLIIGIRGKTIRELCGRADVRILIRPHHDQSKIETHQICSIEGRRDDINKCLHMMRHRFPPNRFPDLNLKPVFPPPAQPPIYPSPELMQLSLPAGAPCEIYISAPVDAGHFFLQLPTHPTFSSLNLLDDTMNAIYNRSIGIPEYALPPKNSVNMMCAAPARSGWYRAVTLCYDLKQDEMLVKFVDYGGFARMARADLRFLLRPDLLTLPFQSIECYLADVEPIDGVSWSEEANTYFQKICTRKIIDCELVGHNRFDGLPYVRLLLKNKKNEVVRFDQKLIEHGFARKSDGSRMAPLPVPKIMITKDKQSNDESSKENNNVESTDSVDNNNAASAPGPSKKSTNKKNKNKTNKPGAQPV